MRLQKLAAYAGLLSLLAAVFSGCGGSSGTSPQGGSVGVYVTDDFRQQFRQVVFTLYRIEVGRQGDPGSFQTVFDDSAGLALDVRALSNIAQFLSVGVVPEGTYNRARITVADQIQVTDASGTPQTLPLDAGVGTPLPGGQLQIEFPIQLTVVASGNTTLVVDFDLPSFSFINGVVRPALRHLRDDNMGNRQHFAEVNGVISALTASGFTLRLRNGRLVSVEITQQTVITSERGTTSTLATGQRVEVKGTVNPSTMVITATRVKIKDPNDDTSSVKELKGIVTQIDTGRFTVRLLRARDITLTSPELTIVYDDQTRWVRDEGQLASPDLLQVDMKVEVKGALESQGVLRALLIELEIEDD